MKYIKRLTEKNSKKIFVPTSKSYLNRALIIAACAQNKITLENIYDIGDDVKNMLTALGSLGIRIEEFENNIVVYGNNGNFLQPKQGVINCGISGTTTRFLIALSALFDFTIDITSEGKMLERPISELVNALRQIGKMVTYTEQENRMPIKIFGKANKNPKQITLNCSKSSQFLTALLMISPILNITEISIDGQIASKSYIDMTIQIMKEFEVKIIHHNNIFHIPMYQKYNHTKYCVESDWSSASYFLALEFLHQMPIQIDGLNLNSLQGDADFCKILDKITKHRSSELLILDMKKMPDTSMTAMIVCAIQNFSTKIIGLETLKDKECNRLQAMQNELAKFGIQTEISSTFDEITIHGKENINLENDIYIETYHDHRIAMCFGILGTITGRIFIQNPEVVNKSFPSFWMSLDSFYE